MLVEENKITQNSNNELKLDSNENESKMKIQDLVFKTVQISSSKITVYLETSYIKLLTTVEGPYYNSGLESSSQMKINLDLNLPTYSNLNSSTKGK